MNIIFYTTDLFPGRERLMPWRTVLEVSKEIQNQGHQVIVVNGVAEKKYLVTYSYQGVMILGIVKSLKNLSCVIKAHNPDTLFLECKWRDAVKGFDALKGINCKKYVYFTGGIYDFQSVCLLSWINGFKMSKPYWFELLIPKSLLVIRLKQTSFDGAIGLTPYTTKIIQSAGYSVSTTLLPGKDNFENLPQDDSILQKYHLKGKRFLCFTGAPAPARGSQLLLKAIDKVKSEDLCVVFLMRKDIGSNFDYFDEMYRRMLHPERVVLIKENLSREQLKSFFMHAWYMILPFIVIPSEIPLTYFEIMSCGTPVLTFQNGGTSDYLKNGLLIVEKSVNGLAKGLSDAWSNMRLRRVKSDHAKEMMKRHPTWNKVAMEWLQFVMKNNKMFE